MSNPSQLIILGTGRCGSSSVHNLLIHHPEVAWLSRVSARFPGNPSLGRLALRMFDLPLPKSIIWRYARPLEAYQSGTCVILASAGPVEISGLQICPGQ